MNETVLLVTGIFLDFSAALILLVPIYRFSNIVNSIRLIQFAIISFGLLPRSFDEETKKMHDEMMFDISKSHDDSEKFSKQMIKYEKDLFPYGMTILGTGFILIIIGTLS